MRNGFLKAVKIIVANARLVAASILAALSYSLKACSDWPDTTGVPQGTRSLQTSC